MNPDTIFNICNMETRQRLSINNSQHVLLVVVMGECVLSNIYDKNISLASGKIILIPSNSMACLTCNNKAKLLTISFDINSLLSLGCINQPLDLLPDNHIKQIDVRERLHSFLQSIEDFINDGIDDVKFYEILRLKLFYIIQLYYNKEEVYNLFKPLLNNDLKFKQKIIDNCINVSSLNELAALTNYSKSGFIQKFHRCFGISPYKWIVAFKAKRILHDIQLSDIPFKEIADNYGFESYSYFYTFCKKHYGKSPNSIRKAI